MAEHIATILGTVLCARALADITVYLYNRHKEKKQERLNKEYELKCINKKLDDICILIQERRENGV